MLIETPDVRQIPGEGCRRWFADEYFDLIVWYDAGSISGFQLCYDKSGHPHAFTWTRGHGARHNAIDDGDDASWIHKASPILVADGMLDVDALARRFRSAADAVPADLHAFVLERLEKQGRELPAARDGGSASPAPR